MTSTLPTASNHSGFGLRFGPSEGQRAQHRQPTPIVQHRVPQDIADQRPFVMSAERFAKSCRVLPKQRPLEAYRFGVCQAPSGIRGLLHSHPPL